MSRTKTITLEEPRRKESAQKVDVAPSTQERAEKAKALELTLAQI